MSCQSVAFIVRQYSGLKRIRKFEICKYPLYCQFPRYSQFIHQIFLSEFSIPLIPIDLHKTVLYIFPFLCSFNSLLCTKKNRFFLELWYLVAIFQPYSKRELVTLSYQESFRKQFSPNPFNR